MTIGEYINQKRRILGYSERELARRINIHNTTINKIENGKIKKPNYLTLKKISITINEPIEILLKLANYTKEEFKLLNIKWED